MKSSFVILAGDEEIEVDDTPENRKKARARGLDIHEILRSPKGEEAVVPERLAEAAIKKGYQFSDTYVKPPKREPMYGGLEAGAMAATESALLGFDDEIIGRGRQIFRGEDYEKARDLYRAEKKWAKEDNPEEYFGGQLAGGIGSAAVMPLSLAGKGAGLAARATGATLEGAALGGAAGLGMSEDDTLSGQAKDLAQGAGTGALMGGGITAVTGAAGKAIASAPPVRKMMRSAYQKIGEVPDHLADKIQANPGIVDKARNFQGTAALSDDIAGAANRLRQEQAALSDEAWTALIAEDKKGRTIRGSILANRALKVAQDQKLLGSSQKAQIQAKRMLKDAMEDVSRVNSFSDLKTAIERIDANINWDKASNTVSNKALQQFRTLMDEDLKKIPAYRKAMAPLAAKTKAIQELQNKFGLKKGSSTVNGDVEPRFYPTDRTITQAETQGSQSLMENSKGNYTREMLKAQAPEVLEQIEALGMDKFMQRDIGRGSRSALMGSAGGFILDLFGAGGLGTAIGGAAGYARDKVGRSFAVEGLARLGMASQNAGQRVGGRVPGILEKAAQKGRRAYIVTHQLLLERDPEYKRAFEEEMKSEQ